MLVVATGSLGGSLLGRTRPKAAEYLVLATAVLSVAAVIGMIASQL